jgi:hypothetical protein
MKKMDIQCSGNCNGCSGKRIIIFEKTNKFWHIPIISLSNHLNGKTRSRKQRPQGVLTNQEDGALMAWILGMQKCELSTTLHQLKMKVAKLTETKPTPFKNGIPRNFWWYWFKC